MSTRGQVLHFSLQEFPAEGPPSEFRLFSKGINNYQKEGMADPGQITFDDKSSTELMRRFNNSGRDKMVIDYDHATFNDKIQDKIAAGWFKPAIRDGELWATDVTWTPKAEQHLKNKELRFYSPTVEFDDDGRVIALRPCAITNDPALCNLRPLMAASAHTHGDKPMKLVMSALGIAEDADEAAALSAVHRLNGISSQVLALSGAATLDEAFGVLAAQKQTAGEVMELKARIAKQETEALNAAFDVEIAAAEKAGKITPAPNDEARALALSFKPIPGGLAMVKAYFKTLTARVVVAGAAPAEPATAPGSTITLSAEEKRLADKMGNSHDAVLKNKIRLAARPTQPRKNFEDDETDAA